MDVNDSAETSTSQTDEEVDLQGEYKCTVCENEFNSFTDCMRHELLTHGLSKKKKPKTSRARMSAIVKSFKETLSNANHELRLKIKEAMRVGEANPSQLEPFFKIFCANAENLEIVYDRIYDCLMHELENVGTIEIYAFGSIANGLALKDCDMDLFIDTHADMDGDETANIKQAFNKIFNILRRSESFSDVFAIRHARVPIIKCCHNATGFKLDINITNPISIFNTNFYRDINNFDKRLHEFMRFIKIWAKHLQIVGGPVMTSYCLSTLALFYLQQTHPDPDHGPLVPSIKDLQMLETPQIVTGVNYAYNLDRNMKKIPEEFTTMKLIKGFFEYYKSYKFDTFIVAPYLGAPVPIRDFKSGVFVYSAYELQKRAQAMLGDSSEVIELQIERSMVVQDPFCLNHNVAKSVSQSRFEYFMNCIKFAHEICSDPAITTDAELIDALFFSIMGHIVNFESMNTPPSTSQKNFVNVLSHRFTPRRTELRDLMKHLKPKDGKTLLHRLWVQCYMDAIRQIVTEVYCLEMYEVANMNEQHTGQQEKTTYRWNITGTVDTWTGRQYQRSKGQSFMDYQVSQTELFLRTRRQNAGFVVQLNAILTANIICDYMAIELLLTFAEPKPIHKKDSLSKFFASFKTSLQNFNIHDKLPAILLQTQAQRHIKPKTEAKKQRTNEIEPQKPLDLSNVVVTIPMVSLKMEPTPVITTSIKQEIVEDNNNGMCHSYTGT